MSDVVLRIQNCYSWLITSNLELKEKLWTLLRFRERNYQHSRLFKQKIWDGFTDFFNKGNGKFLTGLLPEIKCALKHWETAYTTVDERNLVEFRVPEITDVFLQQWQPAGKKALTLYDYQVDLVNQAIKHHRGIITAATGAGKAQPLDALIYTPTGPIKMGDIKVGDTVCTPAGGVAAVIGVYPQGEKEIYEIGFNNGDSVRCCLNHLWEVDETSETYENKIVDTKYLIENLVCPSGKHKHSIKNPNPIHFTPQEVDIDPYLMGLLLGDGRFAKYMVGFSCAEGSILEWITENIRPDYALRYDSKYDYYISRREIKGNGKTNFYIDAIKKYGLHQKKSDTKFIPAIYKYNSVKSRLELVRGLLDTDGYVGKNGHVTLSTSSIRMCQDFKEIIESLGMICRVRSKIPTYTYKGEKKIGKRSYTVTVSAASHSHLFKLTRKIDRTIKKTRLTKRIIKSIKPIGKQECQCIMLDDPNHLYITDNCIVTHNTEWMISTLKALPQNTPTLILANKASLVAQNYERLAEWGFKNFGRVYGKYYEPGIFTCATVQSLHKIEKLLPYIKALIVDEVHNNMSKVPRKFYNKLKNASIRFAVSATWQKFGGNDKCQKYAVKGYFGPVLKTSFGETISTAKLQERGTLSKSNCTFYPITDPTLLYEIYLDAATKGIAENWGFHEIVRRLVFSKCTGRTLILVERISHGDALKSLIPEAHWIAGRDDLETRKKVIDKLYKDNKGNAIGIATGGIFSDGINVHIHNLINAAGGQADHLIIQRMGRGLRPADDKSTLNYYDFMFFINEYLEKHSKKRVRVLRKEGHDVTVKESLDF